MQTLWHFYTRDLSIHGLWCLLFCVLIFTFFMVFYWAKVKAMSTSQCFCEILRRFAWCSSLRTSVKAYTCAKHAGMITQNIASPWKFLSCTCLMGPSPPLPTRDNCWDQVLYHSLVLPFLHITQTWFCNRLSPVLGYFHSSIVFLRHVRAMVCISISFFPIAEQQLLHK